MEDKYKKVTRIKATFRLHPDTIAYLKELKNEEKISQAKIIENLVDEYKKRKKVKI